MITDPYWARLPSGEIVRAVALLKSNNPYLRPEHVYR